MFEPRCGTRMPLSFPCGTSRLNAQITFWECGLPEKHDGPHHDYRLDETWPTAAMEEAEMADLRRRAGLPASPDSGAS